MTGQAERPPSLVTTGAGDRHEVSVDEQIARIGAADVVVAFYTWQRGVLLKHKGSRAYKNALLQPMRAAFAVRKGSKELREALDGVLKEMWADGSLNKIKRVYLDPLEIEPAMSP